MSTPDAAAPTTDVQVPTPDVATDTSARDTSAAPDTSSPADTTPATLDPAVVAVMKRVADWQIPRMGTSRSWVNCAGWSGIMAVYHLTGDTKYLEATKAWGTSGNWTLSAPGEPRGDVQCAAQVYYETYLAEPTPANMVRVNGSRPSIDTVVNGNLRGRVEWSWQDALFMVPPGFARLGKITGEQKYFDVLNRMWWDVHAFLWNPQVGLMYRDDRLRTTFWSRGNGWVIAGIARVLPYLPANDPRRADFVAMLKSMAAAFAKVQGSDGFYRSNLLQPGTMGPESSGTAFIAFGLSWGINNGHLDRATYLPVVKKAWDALLTAVSAEGRLGYVQSIGDRPAPAGPTESHPFGVGAFLLAGSEIAKIGL
jgi:unsaturated rhamnogalacturonyl hydrolase